jgi:hypothetical protein
MCLFSNCFLFVGQLSSLEILPMRRSLSFCSMLQSKRRWSTFWLPPPQGHSGDSLNFSRDTAVGYSNNTDLIISLLIYFI